MTLYRLKKSDMAPEAAVQWTGENFNEVQHLVQRTRTQILYAPRYQGGNLRDKLDSLLLANGEFPCWIERGDWITAAGGQLDVWPAVPFGEKFEAVERPGVMGAVPMPALDGTIDDVLEQLLDTIDDIHARPPSFGQEILDLAFEHDLIDPPRKGTPGLVEVSAHGRDFLADRQTRAAAAQPEKRPLMPWVERIGMNVYLMPEGTVLFTATGMTAFELGNLDELIAHANQAEV